MDNTPSIGSFGSIIGGGSPIALAMARRGYDTSILNQISPGSANFQPLPTPTRQTNNALPQMQGPAVPPPPGAGQPAPQQAPQMPQAMPNPEAQLIVKALAERLKQLG